MLAALMWLGSFVGLHAKLWKNGTLSSSSLPFSFSGYIITVNIITGRPGLMHVITASQRWHVLGLIRHQKMATVLRVRVCGCNPLTVPEPAEDGWHKSLVTGQLSILTEAGLWDALWSYEDDAFSRKYIQSRWAWCLPWMRRVNKQSV